MFEAKQNLQCKRLGSILSLLFLGVLTCSCAQMMGSDRSFVDEMDRETDGFFVAGKDFPVVPGDNGRAYRSREMINRRTPASGLSRREQKYQKSLQQELRQKINELPDYEYDQYMAHRSSLKTPSEKIYYFDLSPRERVSYIRTKRSSALRGPKDKESRGMSRLRSVTRAPASKKYGQGMSFYESRNAQHSPLQMGMSKDQVVGRWGRPKRVDVAGNPRNENERWLFNIGGNKRKVYFSDGRVDGWSFE